MQACLAGSSPLDPSPLLRELTDQAVEGVLRDHALPQSDSGLVYSYARNSARAYLWGELLQVIAREERNSEEEEIVDFYASQLRELRIRQAEISEEEYAKFAANPCGYAPPPPYEFDPPFACGLPLADLFSTSAAHPTFEEFEAYGISEVTRQDVLEDPEALKIAGGTRNALLLGAGLAASLTVALGVFVVLYAAGATSALVTTIVGLTAPYALVPFSGTVVTGVIGGIAGVAGAVGIVIFAVVGSVLIVKDFVDYQDFVDEVTTLVEKAQVTPDLRTEIESERGRSDLYQAYLKSTQPEFLPYGNVPAASPDDPQFEVMDQDGIQLAIQPSIQLGLGDASAEAGLISLRTRLYGGWFVPTVIYTDSDLQQQEVTSLSLATEFVDWDGVSRVAWRRGNEFVVRTGSENIEDISITPELHYLDPDGNRRIAAVFVDDTPPVVTSVLSGLTLNDSGWYVSPVDLQWDIEDPETEIISIQGCESVAVSTDGVRVESCTATSPGGTTSKTVTIRRDTQPPSLSSSGSPPPNAQGWNNTDVVVSYTCEDPPPGSGVASCPDAVTLTQEGLLVVPAKTARDVAGNIQIGASTGVSIDKTPPSLSVESSPPANAAGWNNTDVVVSYTCVDPPPGSGVASCPDDVTLTQEGLLVVPAKTARDVAGNIQFGASTGVSIDKTPPSLSVESSPPANAAGWNNTDVVVSYTCEDPTPGSGVAACPDDITLTQEGLLVVPAKTARDVAGNIQIGASTGVSIDRTPPQVSIVAPGDGATYVTNQDVTVSWEVTDALSGLAQPPSASSASGSRLDTAAAGEFQFMVMARDAAGNEAQVVHSYSVLSPEQAALQLADTVSGLDTGRRVRSALISKLASAARAFATDRGRAAVNKLQAFINQVQALDGKKLSPEDAAILLSQARIIIEAVQ